MKKTLIIFVAVLFILTLSAFSCDKKSEEENVIGGETDEHGCLIGAGYSWCESKQKCIREWEEDCPTN